MALLARRVAGDDLMTRVPLGAARGRRWLMVAAVVSPAVLCVLIMLPRLLSPQFGLFDDGRTVAVSRSLLSGNLDSLWEPQSGRSRPIYWIFNAFLYALGGPTPSVFFLANLLILVLLTLGIGWLVLRLGGHPFQAWLSACLFAISGPIVESFYTLSKPEPLQLLWILIAILASTCPVSAFWSWRNAGRLAGMAAALLLADLTKETSIVLVPLSLAWWIIVRWRDRRQPSSTLQSASFRFLLASLLAASVFVALRLRFSGLAAPSTSYGANYQIGLSQVAASSVRWGGWLLYDSAWLLPLLTFLVIRLRTNRPATNHLWTIACLLWIATWVGVYLPWKYAVEYYLLPFAAGGALAAALAIERLVNIARTGSTGPRVIAQVCLAISLCLLAGNAVNALTNARVQLAVDAANQEMLGDLARVAPAGGTVLVNIRDSNEYVDEIGLHLALLMGRADLKAEPFPIHGQDLDPLQKPTSVVVSPFLLNEPSLSVRMGVIETASAAWNKALALSLGDGVTPTFKSERRLRLVIVDYPRLLCPMMRAIAYCREPLPLFDLREMDYGWNGFRFPESTRATDRMMPPGPMSFERIQGAGVAPSAEMEGMS